MKKNLILLITLVLLMSALPVFAHNAGDTVFSVRIGADVLAFVAQPETGLVSGKDFNISNPGFDTSLSFQRFVNKKTSVGGEIGYTFLRPVSNKAFSIVPLTFKADTVAVETDRFDLKFSFQAGVAYMKYDQTSYFPSPILSVGVNPVLYLSDIWGIGLETGFRLQGELYYGQKASQSALFGLVPISITAVYTH